MNHRAICAAVLLCIITLAHVGEAWAFGQGRGNRGFGKEGALGRRGTPAPPLIPCTSTGIFNLSNTCNDIYFIGAMK